MSERICLLHHLEELWSEGLSMYGTSFEEEVAKVVDYLKAEEFDRVILVRFEDFELGPEHSLYGLDQLVDQVEAYGYGWEREELEEQYSGEEGITWAEGCDHSEVVMLDDWMKNLAGQEVTLTGAFDNECIATISAALTHCGVDFIREEGLIVGSGVEYQFRQQPDVDLDYLKDCVEDNAQSQIDIEIKSPSEGRDDILRLMLFTDYGAIYENCVRDGAHEVLFGFSAGDTVCLDDLSMLRFDAEDLGDTEAMAAEEVDLDQPAPIQAIFEDGAFTVHPQDYPLLRLYQDIGVNSIPVQIDHVRYDPFAYVNLSWDSQAKYEKLKSAARRKFAPENSLGISSAC